MKSESQPREKKLTVSISVYPGSMTTIEKAALLDGRSVSAFMEQASIQAAKLVIQSQAFSEQMTPDSVVKLVQQAMSSAVSLSAVIQTLNDLNDIFKTVSSVSPSSQPQNETENEHTEKM